MNTHASSVDNASAVAKGDPMPVDTLEHPHEPVVVTGNTLGLWSLTLVGPVIWIVHFAFVYLFAEASCEAQRTDEMRFIGEDALRRVVIGATAIGVLGCLLGVVIAWRRRDRVEQRAMTAVAATLAVGSAASILAVGLPVLVLGPC